MTVKLPAAMTRGGSVLVCYMRDRLCASVREGLQVCRPVKPRTCAAPAQVVSSFCDGNTLGPHIIGDLVCLLLALAQAPWLCSLLCSPWGRAGCAAWLVTQVRRLRASDDFWCALVCSAIRQAQWWGQLL